MHTVRARVGWDRVAMGIRQLPSGSFQVRFRLDHAAYVATFPTREMAEEGELLMRANALAGNHAKTALAPADSASAREALRAVPAAEQNHDSSEAAAVIDRALAGLSLDESDTDSEELLTTTRTAAMLGVSRPTLVSWLEAGRVPFHRHGTHRRIRRSDLDAIVRRSRSITDSAD